MKIIDDAKNIAELIKESGRMDLHEKVLDLRGQIIDLTEKNRSLEDENRKLKETLSLSKKMTYKQPYYFQEGDEVPHCPLCYERDGKPIHMKGPHRIETGGTYYSCPSCRSTF